MRTTIYLSAPEGQRWRLDADTVEERIQHRWPQVAVRRTTGRATGSERLSCAIDLGEQEGRLVYQQGGPLVLDDGEPGEWSDTIAWFLAMLPAGSGTVAMTGHNRAVVPVARGATADQIRDLLDRHNEAR